MKLKTLSFALSLGLGLALSAPANSGLIVQQWNLQDDDIDFVLTPDSAGPFEFGANKYSLKLSGTVALGDLLISALEVPTAAFRWYDTNTKLPISPPQSLIPAGKELTGIVALEVTGTPAGGLSFSPFSQGLDSIISDANGNQVGAGNGGGAGGGAMVALFLNNNTPAGTAETITDQDLDLVLDQALNPATNCNNLLACLHQATLGSLFQVDGFAGDKDETWTYSGVTDIGVVKGGGDTTTFGAFNFALSNFFNVAEPVCFQQADQLTVDCEESIDTLTADGWVQVRGSGTLQGGVSLTNGAAGHSDFDARKYVPEPATLALVGAGLLGLGFRFQRRKA